MRFTPGHLVVDTDADGRVVSVRTRRRPERSYLRRVDLGPVVADGRTCAWRGRDVAVDADEVSVRVRAEGLELTLRHSFAAGWTTRLLIVNTGERRTELDRVVVAVDACAQHRVSGHAAGSRACWAVQRDDGDGVLIGGRLVSGSLSAITADGLELDRLALDPGQRYVLQWRWDTYVTPRSVVLGPGQDVLVGRTVLHLGEAALLPDDPDAALVVPPGIAVDTVEGPELAGSELSAAEPGTYRVELRSADGDVRLDLTWVRPLTEQLAGWADQVLGRPRTGAGVVAIDDVAAGVVLQAALGSGSCADADEATDALDRYAARLVTAPDPEPDPLTALFLLGEHGRTGDPDLLDAALHRVATLLEHAERAVPGLGLAVLRSALAGAERPETVTGLLARAVALAERDAAGADPVAELELRLAVRPLVADPEAEDRLRGLVRRLGAGLGAGLPGRLLPPPEVDHQAYRVAVLRLLPEDGLREVTRAWGDTPVLLAHRLTAETLDRLGDVPGPAAAWLSLVQPQA